MGGTTFFTYGVGKDVQSAFLRARDEEAWEHGHGGYTGTIAEKGGFVLLEHLPLRWTPERVEQALGFWERDTTSGSQPWYRKQKKAHADLVAAVGEQKVKQWTAIYDDKWGDCIAVEVEGVQARRLKERFGRKGTRDRVFAFMGWASC